MQKLNQKGIVHLLLPLILIIGLIAGVYLVTSGNPLKLFSKASMSKPTGPETSLTLVGPNECEGIWCLFPQPQEEFNVRLYARSDIEQANLFTAKITFPKDLVEVVEIKLEDKFNEVENYYDNNTGEISVVGGVPAPGLQTQQGGESALMATVVFKAKTLGKGTVALTDDSAIYSNLNNINILTIKRNYDVSVEVAPPPTPTPSPSPANPIHTSANCTGSALQVYVAGDIPSPSDRNLGLWSTLTDEKTGQSMIYEYDANQGPPTIHIAANFPATGAIRGSSIPIIGDGRTYTVKVYAAAYTTGMPTLGSPVAQNSFSKTCTGPTLTVNTSDLVQFGKFAIVWNSISNPHNSDKMIISDSARGDILTLILNFNCRPTGFNGLPQASGVCSIEKNSGYGGFTDGSYSVRLISGASDNIIAAATFDIDVIPSDDKGDGNKDGKINLIDMSVLHTTYRMTSNMTGFKDGIDMNDDKVINAFDFSGLRGLLQKLGVIKVKDGPIR